MFHCDFCIKSFRTLKGHDMHVDRVHPQQVKCCDCDKVFKTEEACQQHYNAVHYDSEYDDEVSEEIEEEWRPSPPVDSKGLWVHREEFKGFKSFGYYQCIKCCKTWFSAHAHPNYRQACKKCEVWEYPRYLWQNLEKDVREKKPKEDEEKKPHDQNRCEACKIGECLRAIYVDY